jgi:hypothetical protein
MNAPLRVLRAALIALVVCSATGCFRYSTVTPSELRPGEVASVWLAPRGASSLATALGPRTSRLEGRIISASDSMVTVAVTTIVRSPGQEEFWPGDSVRVCMSDVDSLRVRRLDGPRSLLASSGVVAAAVAGRALANGQIFGRGGSSGPPVSR